MPTANDNNAFLSINGVDVSGIYTGTIEPEITGESVDVTRGAGQGWMQRAAGLKDIKITFTIAYDTVTAGAYIASMTPDVYPIVYYPQGSSATGTPAIDADFNITSIKGIATSIEKEAKVWEITAELADTPRKEFATGTVS